MRAWLARNPKWVVLTAIILIASAAYCLHKFEDYRGWVYICFSEGRDIGYEKINYYAKDRPREYNCLNCELHPELKLKVDPRIAIKAEPNSLSPLKEKVLQCDCQKRRYWIQACVPIDGYAWENTLSVNGYDWIEVTPGGVDEKLLNYACRNWKEDDRRVGW